MDMSGRVGVAGFNTLLPDLNMIEKRNLMRRLACIIALLGIGPISLLIARPVLAFPSLPSSFYGTVKVNGANIPDGTLVQALINGKVIIENQTQTYQGDSFYSLDIPADDPDTLVVDGGKDGDTITFIMGGIVADQAGTWKSATIVPMNLSASSSVTLLIPAQVTFTSIPTQTVIMLVAETPALLTAKMQPAPTITVATNPENNPAVSSKNQYIGFAVAGFVLFVILFTIVYLKYIRRSK
jgi:hypothetical protein